MRSHTVRKVWWLCRSAQRLAHNSEAAPGSGNILATGSRSQGGRLPLLDLGSVRRAYAPGLRERRREAEIAYLPDSPSGRESAVAKWTVIQTAAACRIREGQAVTGFLGF